MKGALIILAATIVIGLVLWLSDRRWRRRTAAGATSPDASPSATPEEEPAAVGEEAADGECCGRHAVCEKTSLSPLTDEIVYYDDHELDRFADRSPESYLPAEVEEFRDILLSMRAEDVAGWSRSLQLRRISLPYEVRDEVLLVVGDLRSRS